MISSLQPSSASPLGLHYKPFRHTAPFRSDELDTRESGFRSILQPNRESPVSWVDQRLVNDKHVERCSAPAWGLYLLLVVVGDAQGLSYYSDATICRLAAGGQSAPPDGYSRPSITASSENRVREAGQACLFPTVFPPGSSSVNTTL
jgi:hypothetical protein